MHQIFTLIFSLETTPRHSLEGLFLPAHTAFLWMLFVVNTPVPKPVPPADSWTVSRGIWEGHELPHLPSTPHSHSKQLTVFFIFSMKLLSLTGAALKDRRNLLSDKHIHSLRSAISKWRKGSPQISGRPKGVTLISTVPGMSMAQLQGFSAHSHGAEGKS